MAKYRVTGPDGAAYEVNAPDGSSEADVMAYVQSQSRPKPSKPDPVKSAADDVGAVEAFGIGVGRTFDKGVQGVRQIYNAVTGDQATLDAMKADEADKDARYRQLSDKRPIATTLGEIGAVAAALPVSGAATLPATALRFGIAGAVPGLVSYGTPEERLASGAFGLAGGAVAPYAVNKLGQVGARFLTPGGDAAGAKALARAADMAPADLAAKIQAGAAPMVPGVPVSTPQAAMVPNVSQLWRTLETTPNGQKLADFNLAQDAARKAALSKRVGKPSGFSSIDAAENASSIIMQRAQANKAAAKAAASDKFKNVDPMRESGLQLPMEDIKASYGEIFGVPGAKPPAGDLPRLMADLTDLTTPAKQKALASKRGPVDPSVDSLADAIRKWGGLNISEGGGELKWLRESDLGKKHPLGPFARKQGGLTFEQAAERAQQAGYLGDFDQKELLDKLMAEARGELQFAERGLTNRANSQYDAALADVAKPVTWETLQALRSRAGDIVAEANRTQTNLPEAKVAGQIKAALDDTMARVSRGEPFPDQGFPENFTPEMQARARDALNSWRQYKQDFSSGPAAKIGRYGSDGKPMLDGAEAVKAFVNSKATQRPDAEQLFKVLPGVKDFDARQAARGYVMADLLEKAAPADKPLSPAMFDRYMQQRGPMLEALFPGAKLEALKGSQAELNRAAKARDLARVAGSDTAQKLNNLGLLDSPWLDRIINFVPTQTARTLLTGVANAAKSGARDKTAEKVVPLLMDPTLALTQLERLALIERGLLGQPQVLTGAARLGAATGAGLLGN